MAQGVVKKPEVNMILDIHVHPFCKEAHVTPNLEEGIQRMFEKHEPKVRERMKATAHGFIYQAHRRGYNP